MTAAARVQDLRGIQPVGIAHQTAEFCFIVTGLRGLRVSELASLDLGAFSEQNAQLSVLGKGRKERNVPVGELCQGALLAYLPARELLRQHEMVCDL